MSPRRQRLGKERGPGAQNARKTTKSVRPRNHRGSLKLPRPRTASARRAGQGQRRAWKPRVPEATEGRPLVLFGRGGPLYGTGTARGRQAKHCTEHAMEAQSSGGNRGATAGAIWPGWTTGTARGRRRWGFRGGPRGADRKQRSAAGDAAEDPGTAVGGPPCLLAAGDVCTFAG